MAVDSAHTMASHFTFALALALALALVLALAMALALAIVIAIAIARATAFATALALVRTASSLKRVYGLALVAGGGQTTAGERAFSDLLDDLQGPTLELGLLTCTSLYSVLTTCKSRTGLVRTRSHLSLGSPSDLLLALFLFQLFSA